MTLTLAIEQSKDLCQTCLATVSEFSVELYNFQDLMRMALAYHRTSSRS